MNQTKMPQVTFIKCFFFSTNSKRLLSQLSHVNYKTWLPAACPTGNTTSSSVVHRHSDVNLSFWEFCLVITHESCTGLRPECKTLKHKEFLQCSCPWHHSPRLSPKSHTHSFVHRTCNSNWPFKPTSKRYKPNLHVCIWNMNIIGMDFQ